MKPTRNIGLKLCLLPLLFFLSIAYSYEHDDNADDYGRAIHDMRVLLRLADYNYFITDMTEHYHSDRYWNQQDDECYDSMEEFFVILTKRFIEIKSKDEVGSSPKIHLESIVNRFGNPLDKRCYEEYVKPNFSDSNEADNPNHKPEDFIDLTPDPEIGGNVWKDEDFRDYWGHWKDEDMYDDWQRWKDEDPNGDWRDWPSP